MGRPTELTKEYLQKQGITHITKDGHVFMGDLELNHHLASKSTRWDTQKYNLIFVYDHDLYEARKSKYKSAGMKAIVLSRAIWAWYNDLTPANMDVDHINNNSLDDRLDNLQILTRKENLAKRRGHKNQYNNSLIAD